MLEIDKKVEDANWAGKMPSKQMKEQEIQKQAKKIMDNFVSALDKIKEPKEFGIEREKSARTAEKSKYGKEFRDRMLANAPKKNDNFLIAEKKHW